MFHYEQHAEVDSSALAELFARVGWEEADPGRKLEWLIATSEDWVTCSMDGELVGFGRIFRLDSSRRVLFDLVVDERFEGFGVDHEILRRLAGSFPPYGEVEVFRQVDAALLALPGEPTGRLEYWAPEAPPGAYLG